jgi:hypothetical protein
VATRYDRLAANYLAFVQLASIRLWLRLNEFASWLIAIRAMATPARHPGGSNDVHIALLRCVDAGLTPIQSEEEDVDPGSLIIYGQYRFLILQIASASCRLRDGVDV